MVAGAFTIGLLLAEWSARLLVTHDVDGNLYQSAFHLKPYRLPVKMVSGTVERYLNSTNSILVYDAELGWLPRASQQCFNAEAIWSLPEEFSKDRTPGTLRIAVFGGSYALGKTYTTGWSTLMARGLSHSGIKPEVLNFGVPGYSMDQAFLRWQKEGKGYHPHIVIFGFNAGYCSDNLNLVRSFQHPGTEIVFFKPRFELVGGKLNLLNVPTPAPDELAEIIADFPNWNLADKERYYNPMDYQTTWYSRSRLAALAVARWQRDGTRKETADFYQPDGEPARLALTILSHFRHSVENSGGMFAVAHLPSENHLLSQRADGRMEIAGLLTALAEVTPLLDPTPMIMKAAEGKKLAGFFQENHYSEALHEVIGKAVAAQLLEQLPITP